MDVVWLKKDIRAHDHAPLSTALCSKSRELLIIYVYEPSQLGHKTVHGSHVLFQNEGLRELEARLSREFGLGPKPITYFYGEVTEALDQVYGRYPFDRLLAHEETGHLASFERDKNVRRWCKERDVRFIEYQQVGVTRGLRNRDEFTRGYNAFMSRAQCALPKITEVSMSNLSERMVRGVPSCGILSLRELAECLDEAHAEDRTDRLKGGESEALAMMDSFLKQRGEGYARGVSSPNSAWNSCSRLSPYLAFGHISARYVVQELTKTQRRAREERKNKRRPPNGGRDEWVKSLAAFHSRLRWRAHFIQKLESQPDMEIKAQCIPLNEVRCGAGDWNEEHFQAWREGRTGYPMVDACMRCLVKHGWINFRMRAMLVSFACYNLWLDWRGIAGHLGRCFLDLEPGIHYSQLQMQAGVTGINAMRVYSATKQAKDQDGKGLFIKRYVPELKDVPVEFIHEPWKMGEDRMREVAPGYPGRIVEEKESASRAKSLMQKVRQRKETKVAAEEVYRKLGSRVNRVAGNKRKREQERRQQEQGQQLISKFLRQDK